MNIMPRRGKKQFAIASMQKKNVLRRNKDDIAVMHLLNVIERLMMTFLGINAVLTDTLSGMRVKDY